MQITKEKLPKSQVALTIELSTEEFKDYYNKAIKKISQETKIAGFRPGKVPEEIIKQKVGEEKIQAEASEEAIRDSYFKALEQEKLAVVSRPKIDILKQAAENPFIFKATVALLPEIKLGNYKGVKVKKRKVAVKEEEVTKTLKDLQKIRRKETRVNREARKGDKVEVDINVYLDKIPIEGGTAKNQPIVIGEGHFIPGFEDHLVGLKENTEKEFELRFPKDYFQKNLANRLAEFKIRLTSVFELETPNLDDVFAQSLGKFQNLIELRNQIRKNIEQELSIKEDQRVELEILDTLIRKSAFEDLPELLVESELSKMISELKYDLERQNLKYEDYLTSIKKTEEEVRKSFTPQAERRVKTALVIRKISELENIEATEEELEKELQETRSRHQGNPDMLKRIDAPDFQNFIYNVLVNRKVLEILKKLAVGGIIISFLPLLIDTRILAMLR